MTLTQSSFIPRVFLRVLTVVLLAAMPVVAYAESAGEVPAPIKKEAVTSTPAETPDSAKSDVPRLPVPVTTHHVLDQDGTKLDFTATAGALEPLDDDGEPVAEIFYVAYAAKPENTARPITFVFNGGPGAASTYLHLGAMGPKVVATTENGALTGPPARLIANNASWLDFTDLVFVDPVGTGFSRARGENSGKDFWGVDQDANSIAEFIRLYLTATDRMGSPVFLAGESYGGFRAAVLTRKLQRTGAVSPSGIVLISPALEFSIIRGKDFDPLPWALTLPSYAAVKLESEGLTTRDELATALQSIEQYAMTDYLVALASGVEPGGKAASAKVAELTGLPLEKVERQFARVPQSLFVKEFDRDGGQVLSMYDGSVGGPDPHPASAWPRGPDPVLDATVPLWSSAFVRYVSEDLDYKTDEEFRLLNRTISNRWDYGTSPTRQGYAGVLDDIQDARAANRNLGVFIASGYTDLVTPYSVPPYLVSQLPPLKGAPDIEIHNYAGGHMLYLREGSRKALKQDVEAMYHRILNEDSS
ncbi:MAG: peptidase S10 [Pseudomonadota bacterium]